jgi:phosphohistidine swiveling domain-containing protein
MIYLQSKKWRIFASRPTSILKRDFIKWTYLSIDKIRGLKLSKLLAIGNEQEMDVFVGQKEDGTNYSRAVRQFQSGETLRTFKKYDDKIAHYRPHEIDPVKRSLEAMKEIGPILIYSYYIERMLGKKRNNKAIQRIIFDNTKLRDSGARIVYPMYDKAYNFLQKKFKNKKINNFTLEELRGSLKKDEIDRRSGLYVFFGTKNNSSIFTGKSAAVFLKKEGFSKTRKVLVETVKGLTACVGRVKDEVRVVCNLDDIKRSAGKVVVSRDTIIEYAPFLKKALAIITDLGGISSHAAIVAREFKIPCIVGTKVATKVFKDGDLVEVDANKGIVKLVKRK